MELSSIQLKSPYLLFLGDEKRAAYAKTAFGMKEWRSSLCKGQLRLHPDTVDLGMPDMTVGEAATAGIGSLIFGTAPIGGRVPDEWVETLVEAAEVGLDIVAGLHFRLNETERLRDAAKAGGARLIDVRVPPRSLPVGTGRKRAGLRLLTVGTDCAIGKKFTALSLERDMREAGLKADFRATGQTGIMIAGSGIPIDAVVADFLSGAAEVLSPDNDPDHWDIVEGQGAIFHPGFSGVSHGLLVGSQPDAIVVCHQAGRTHIEEWPGFKLRNIGEVIQRNIEIGRLTNPGVRCVGISVNTSTLPSSERVGYLASLSEKHNLPCIDPSVEGTQAIITRIRQEFPDAQHENQD